LKRNIIREKLDRNEPTLSTHLLSTWPSAIEAIGHTGAYDYIEFVAEYGSFDLHDLDNICRAAELHNLGSMIKVDQSHQEFLGQRGIGSGFNSVLFTDCRSADDVRKCVQIAKADTPSEPGLYGAATRRNTYMGYGGSADYVELINSTVVAVMIEKKGAVEELDQILSIPGVDMIQWGATDYSMSIGLAGQTKHPDVIAARDKVFKSALDKGIPPRAEIGSPDDAKEFIDMGVRHFSIGTDLAILYSWWQENGDALQDTLVSSGIKK